MVQTALHGLSMLLIASHRMNWWHFRWGLFVLCLSQRTKRRMATKESTSVCAGMSPHKLLYPPHVREGQFRRPRSCALVALLPELGGMTRKQVAALVGVAPLRFRERCAQGKALHLGRSCERPPGALHGGDERQ